MDFLSLQRESCIPAHKLSLKEGCICTIMKNLDINEGQVKNRQGFVEGLHERVIKIRLIDTTSPLQTVSIPRITFEFQPWYCLWVTQHHQFPLTITYATRFNSCQGLRLEIVVLDLRTNVFPHGQHYCSESWVIHRNEFKKLMGKNNEMGAARNVVYQEHILPT